MIQLHKCRGDGTNFFSNTSSLMCIQKVWHTKCMIFKFQLLPLAVSDCCACFNYFFLRKKDSVTQLLATIFFFTEKYFYINFLCT